jgi:hypothetical protein
VFILIELIELVKREQATHYALHFFFRSSHDLNKKVKIGFGRT